MRLKTTIIYLKQDSSSSTTSWAAAITTINSWLQTKKFQFPHLFTQNGVNHCG